MKEFIIKILAWCKAHIWQTVVIAVLSVGAVATAITLPIVLSKDETPAEDVDDDEEDKVTKYTVKVANNDNTLGKITVQIGDAKYTAGDSVEVEEGSKFTVAWESVGEGQFESLKINGSVVTGAVSGYEVTANSKVANAQNEINVATSFTAPLPVPTMYSVKVDFYDTSYGHVVLHVGANEYDEQDQAVSVQQGTQLTFTWETYNNGDFVCLIINGNEIYDISSGYQVEANDSIANEQKQIIITATFTGFGPTPE